MKAFRVVDLNGDQDGFPDTNETVDLIVSLRNPTRLQDLTNVVVELETSDRKIDCIAPSCASIASLPADTEAEVPTAFRLHIHPNADRGSAAVSCNDPGPTGTCSNFVEVPGGCVLDSDCYRTALQDYSTKISARITSDQYPAPGPRPQTITLDIDLDSSQPSGATTAFAEGFEGGFGAFQLMNIDDNKASNSASDGYRCQDSNPDNPDSNSYGVSQCYLGFATGQLPVNDWHVHGAGSPDGGRAYEGNRCFHYGKHTPGDPSRDTYGLSQLDALRTKANINLAARVCRDDPGANKRSCNAAADCLAVGGGPCVSANPDLSFKQQVSTVDARVNGVFDDEATDRAVMHVQIGPSTTNPWEKVHPYVNTYDVKGTAEFTNCKFDPIDDGNDEDSFYAPPFVIKENNGGFLAPVLVGPSSTCYPEFVFSFLGDTDAPFAPENIARASDGPGLPGSIGIGTWVESKFDLSRFRGRSVKIRFVFTSIKLSGDVPTWNQQLPGSPADDGWYVDDVRVTQTLGAASPTVSLDNADNSALPGNMDGDARGDECDCAPANPGVFATPQEVSGLKLAADRVTLTWESAALGAGSDTVHDVLRGDLDELPVGGGSSEVCLASGIQDATTSDAAMPAEGQGFWYLARGRNICGTGTYGFRSDGTERTSAACP